MPEVGVPCSILGTNLGAICRSPRACHCNLLVVWVLADSQHCASRISSRSRLYKGDLYRPKFVLKIAPVLYASQPSRGPDVLTSASGTSRQDDGIERCPISRP
jgi:hypothetical protein